MPPKAKKETRPMNIRPVPVIAEVEKTYLHPSVPQGSCLLTAPSASGKSTLIMNLLLKQNSGVLLQYQAVHVFSPTCKSDATWDLIQEDTYEPFDMVSAVDGKTYRTGSIHLHETLDQPLIQKIMSENEALPAPSVCVRC